MIFVDRVHSKNSSQNDTNRSDLIQRHFLLEMSATETPVSAKNVQRFCEVCDLAWFVTDRSLFSLFTRDMVKMHEKRAFEDVSSTGYL